MDEGLGCGEEIYAMMIDVALAAQARHYVPSRVALYAARLGVDYRRIRITSARTRWGSCSRAGNLNFTWRLMMTPPFIIDYVVAHEVAHLKFHNHSREFWHCVAGLYPNYKQARVWLKHRGHRVLRVR